MYPKDYDPNKFVSNPGKRYKEEFRGEVQEDGTIKLVVVGKIDLWQMHNADREACDINNIVERFASGDVSALTNVQGSYMDVAGLPKNLRDMNNLIDQLKHGYSSLDENVRNKFNSFNDWLAMAGSNEWIEKMKVNNNENIEVSENVN